MERDRPASSLSLAQSVNLYCTQCEVQIGIFDNEWIRLTSSYARSKDKGTHFGTQVGERLQIVPPGGARAAGGCQMAEVFCRKCSNMVGQYCKSAPNASQKDFVDQYFYKLSRTFLKDSKTNDKVDPVYAFDTTQERPDSVHRQRSASLRWQNIPLREASSTPITVQAATRNRVSSQNRQNASPLNQEAGMLVDLDHNSTSLDAQPTDASSKSLAASTRRQSTRVVDREGRMYEIEGRLRFHDGRLMDQENFLNDMSARLHEQDSVIEEQRVNIEDQEAQLQQMRDEIAALQSALETLRSSMLFAGTDSSTAQSSFSDGQIDFASHLELLAQTVRGARNAVMETQALREENSKLKSQLEAVGGSVDIADASDLVIEPSASVERATSLLGKRKRGNQQVVSQQSAAPETNITESSGPIAEVVHDPQDSTGGPPAKKKGAKRGRPRKVSTTNHGTKTSRRVTRGANSENNPIDDSAAELDQLPTRSQQETSSVPSNDDVIFAADDSMDWTDGDADNHGNQLALVDSNSGHEEQTQFVQDPAAFDDLDFSDEEDDDNDNEDLSGVQAEVDDETASGAAGSANPVRDGRSTAPEPFLKPKPPANRMRSYITLDRAHIATPWTFWTAIANGQQPKLIKPPAIQTRKKDLEDELIALGLQQWIGKDKKSKEYREAVDAARTKLRNEKRAAMLASKGLRPAVDVSNTAPRASTTSSVLSPIHNVRAQETATNIGAEVVSGDENSQSTSTSLGKDLATETREGENGMNAPTRATRGRVPQILADTNAESTSSSTENHMEELPKRTRKPSERAKAQRNSDHVDIQEQTSNKRPRGRPRKSAPATLASTTDEPEVDNPSQVSPVRADIAPAGLDATTPQLTEESSPASLSANKQQLLEKMRLKAKQNEQLRETMIMAREKLAEEAMAAMEMEEMTA